MARLTRKEMKRDEVMESLETGVHWIQAHARTLILAAVAVLVAAFAVIAFVMFQSARAREANVRLADAMVAYGEASTEASDAAAREDARVLFQGLLEEYGGTEAGSVARLYLGEMAVTDGDLEEARRQWSAFADEAVSSVLAAQASLNLIHLDRSQGELDKVEDRLRKLLAEPGGVLGEDQVLRELAVTLEAMGRDGEAEGIWRRLVQEHPNSPWGAEARERTGAPSAAFPGLEGVS